MGGPESGAGAGVEPLDLASGDASEATLFGSLAY